jgi:hypothetical protein
MASLNVQYNWEFDKGKTEARKSGFPSSMGAYWVVGSV